MTVQPFYRLLVTVAVLAASCAPSSRMQTPLTPSGSSGAPAISAITPSKSPVGTSVTISGSGFASEGNTVKFGNGYIRGVESKDGKTLSFSVPDGLDLCAPESSGPCAAGFPQVKPGDYAVAVITKGDTSNSVTFTVTAR